MTTAIYIKPMTWAGKLNFYVGYKPSNPAESPGYRLGGYFLCTERRECAEAVAAYEAKRMGCGVVTCEHYVGL